MKRRSTEPRYTWCFQLFTSKVVCLNRHGQQVSNAKIYQVKDVQEAHDLCERLNGGANKQREVILEEFTTRVQGWVDEGIADREQERLDDLALMACRKGKPWKS
jgi:hypothetical protein